MPVSADFAIEVHGLRKRFGRTDVLQGIDLTVPRNSVFGFLGPNGAGKSTTMKILVGLLRASSGTASVSGHDVHRDSIAARASIGYLPQDVSYWHHLNVRNVLRFTARRYLHGDRRAINDRVDQVMELAGLTSLANRKVRKLSGGERQRLGVAEAWVGRPDVLILDEPSAGLDPEGRHEVLDLLDRLREHATVFYSTHILDDIERVSDQIAVLDRGTIVAQGPTESFLIGDHGVYSVTATGADVCAFDDLATQPWISSVERSGPDRWEVTVTDRAIADHSLLRLLVGEQSDEAAVSALITALEQERGSSVADLVTVEPIATFADLLLQVGHTDAVIATRYHNVIAGLMMSRPTVSIGYAQKFRAVMTDYGLGGYCHDVEQVDATSVIADLDAVLGRSDEITSELAKSNQRYSQAVETRFCEVFDVVLGAGTRRAT